MATSFRRLPTHCWGQENRSFLRQFKCSKIIYAKFEHEFRQTLVKKTERKIKYCKNCRRKKTNVFAKYRSPPHPRKAFCLIRFIYARRRAPEQGLRGAKARRRVPKRAVLRLTTTSAEASPAPAQHKLVTNSKKNTSL